MAERTIEANRIRLWTEDFGDRRNPTLADDLPGPDPEWLAKTSIPTLVIHGTDDPILPHPHGKALAAAIPGAKLLTFDGMGHDLPVGVWPEIVREMLAVTQRARA